MIDAPKSARSTDARLAEMERHLSRVYSEAERDIRKRWEEFLLPLDKELKKYKRMTEVPMDADVREKAEKKYQQVLREKTLLDKRFQTVTRRFARDISHVNETALAYINGELPPVYVDNCNDISVLIKADVDTKFGINVRFDLVDEDTVRLLAAEDTSLLPYRKIDTAKDVAWNVKIIRSEVLKGILVGEDIPSIAARMKTVVGMNGDSAVRNARTMVTGAQNAGRMEGMKRAESMGIVLRRIWMSAEDGRVRKAHRELDGQVRDMDKPFENAIGKIMFPGDPAAHPANVYNCRCTLGTDIVGFRDPVSGKVTKI